jgi:hypothetical protein
MKDVFYLKVFYTPNFYVISFSLTKYCTIIEIQKFMNKINQFLFHHKNLATIFIKILLLLKRSIKLNIG